MYKQSQFQKEKEFEQTRKCSTGPNHPAESTTQSTGPASKHHDARQQRRTYPVIFAVFRLAKRRNNTEFHAIVFGKLTGPLENPTLRSEFVSGRLDRLVRNQQDGGEPVMCRVANGKQSRYPDLDIGFHVRVRSPFTTRRRDLPFAVGFGLVPSYRRHVQCPAQS